MELHRVSLTNGMGIAVKNQYSCWSDGSHTLAKCRFFHHSVYGYGRWIKKDWFLPSEADYPQHAPVLRLHKYCVAPFYATDDRMEATLWGMDDSADGKELDAMVLASAAPGVIFYQEWPFLVDAACSSELTGAGDRLSSGATARCRIDHRAASTMVGERQCRGLVGRECLR